MLLRHTDLEDAVAAGQQLADLLAGVAHLAVALRQHGRARVAQLVKSVHLAVLRSAGGAAACALGGRTRSPQPQRRNRASTHLAVKHEGALKAVQQLLDVAHVVLDRRQHAVEVAHQLHGVADVGVDALAAPRELLKAALERHLCGGGGVRQSKLLRPGTASKA